ncbi:MAG TPA: hypothetical protein P5291_04795, partial [Flavobacteriales bacterium]|nr:hypothetical protein [Flavobacteriales bacterium]
AGGRRNKDGEQESMVVAAHTGPKVARPGLGTVQWKVASAMARPGSTGGYLRAAKKPWKQRA